MLNYYEIELSPEERLTQQTIRDFVDKEAAPLMPAAFEEGRFPRELVPRLAELGVLGADIPEYGAGSSYMTYGLICQELERADSGLRSFVSVQTSLVMFPIYTYGSEEQKRRYLPGMARGTVIGCFGLTEPDHGSDPASMETRAVRDGGEWVLNGTKMWITNGTFADVALVWARTDDGVRGFLVDTDRRGFQAREVHHKLSLRASNTAELHLEDCRVPESAVLPGVKGMRGPLSCLSEARFGIAWGVLGAAMSCYETALEYAKVRTQFDRPIAGFQLTQAKLVDMLTGITQGQLVAWQLARLKDAHQARPPHISLAKRANVAMALNVARSARSVMGANGISLEYPVIRHMANLETVYTYEGTHEVHTLTVGKDITGLDAFGG
ncbi:MAG TPA: acyl-CoA dehydrogenase family protein [Chloroflexota bacterium]|nr:acyl-CoA dehydrogenase family protein [Chloroflexota bacterium]